MRRCHRAALLPLLFPFPALAQPDAPTPLDPIVVTASRAPEPLSETLAAVTVITRADIERLQPSDFAALLTAVPGISISNTGGAGKTTGVFLRGTESDHVLVLIDGVRIGSATAGTAAFEQIPVEQIERIEIVSGPRASLYGSDALGGVIQIFTRRGGGETAVPSFGIRAGSRGSGAAELGVHGGAGKAWYAASLSGRTTDGINAQRSSGEPDHDGFRQIAGSLRGGWQLGNGGEIGAHYLRAEGDSEYDSAFTGGADSTQTVLEVLGAQARLPLLAHWQTALSAGISRDESDIELDDRRTDRFDTRRDHVAWQNDFTLAQTQSLALGVDYLSDHVDGTTDYAVDARDNTGVFAQYQGGFGAHALQLSLRHDDNEQFGSEQTGGAAWGWRFSDALRLSAAYGTAFKAPSFNELYFPDFGNPDLGPEKARSAEVGLAGFAQHWNWRVHAYRTEIDDLITTVLVDPENFIFAPINVDEALIVGVEAAVDARLGAWRLQTTLGWLDPENDSGENKGKLLRRRARETARVDVDYAFSRAALGATLYAAGKRYENAENTQKLGGYATLALRAEYRVLPAWRLQASVENALNKQYETALTYNQPGATYWLGLRYSPRT